MSTSLKSLHPTLYSWKELYSASYNFNSSFQLELDNNEIIQIDEVIRILPQKRIVVFGSWRGKPIVAKLFIHPQRAHTQVKKDMAGIKVLEKNNIPTPALYLKCLSKDRRIHILIFERILRAQSLNDLWENKINIPSILPILKSVIIELATQHVLGVLQQDLHLKNFLVTKKFIYTLDGAQIKSSNNILPTKICLPNLALFLSQLGVGVEHYQEMLFRHYAAARGWLIKVTDVTELFMHIKKYNELRWTKFQKKIFRNSSEFTRIKDWHTHGMYARKYAQKEFLQFLQHPEAAFKQGELLKAGNSATVLKIEMDGAWYVIKRYNIKNAFHGLRRTLRPTRAAETWKISHKLSLFKISTAKPVAFLEKRFLGLRGKSYAVTEFISSQNAGDYLKNSDEIKINTMIEKIVMLLKSLAKLNLTHGDLKITNILIDANENPVLIDLDGVKEHLSLASFKKTWNKEILRFLKNFNDNPSIKNRFIAELNKL